MKKLMTVMAMAAALVMTLTGCKQESEKTFTVGFDAEFPPYGFLDTKTGEYTGFDLDLAAEVAKRNGWKLVKKPIVWAAKDSEINAGTIDCIWNGFTMTPERMDKYAWSEPYVINKQLIMVRKDSGILKPADIAGKVVLAQDGSSGAEALESFIKEKKAADPSFAVKEFKKVPDYNTAATMLETSAVDAVALDSAVGEELLTKSNGKFMILEEKLADEEYGIGFKKDNTALRDQVQKTLKEMVKDGTAAKIVDIWHSRKVSKGDGIVFILKAD